MERATAPDDLMASQHGLATRRQLIESGMNEGAIAGRLRKGALIRVHHGVYRSRQAPQTPDQVLMAAVLASGDGATVSHQSAARLWGLPTRIPDRPHITTTAGRWRPKQYYVHRSGDLAPVHVDQVRGIPTTTVVRTVLDLGAVEPFLAGKAFRQSLRDRLATLQDYDEILSDVGRQGRAGVGVLRDAVEARRRWESENESVLEDEFMAIVDRYLLPSPVPQHVIRDKTGGFIGRVDFAYPEHRLLIELDGYRYHTDPGAFVRDRNRQNRISLAGYRVLRYTAEDLRSPNRVVGELSQALRSVSAQYS